MQETVKGLIDKKLINAAHDCADGGLFTALIEMSFPNKLGFDIVTDSEVREDAFLFGEAQSRVVVGVSEDQEDDFIEFMMNQKVPYTLLGHVTKGKICVDEAPFGFLEDYRTVYDNALAEALA
jgi:phosphoribosylformylglycinamidine synthase